MKNLENISLNQDEKEIGTFLERLRLSHKETKASYCRTLGVSRAYYDNLINNKVSPTLKTIHKMEASIGYPLLGISLQSVEINPHLNTEQQNLLKQANAHLERANALIKSISPKYFDHIQKPFNENEEKEVIKEVLGEKQAEIKEMLSN